MLTKEQILHGLIFYIIEDKITLSISNKPLFVTQGKAKWDAWNGKKGVSQDEAKQKYIDLANQLKEKHGVQ